MKPQVMLKAGCATDAGLQRRINEDRLLADELHGLFMVADGLGGHAAGEHAAEIALRTIERYSRELDTGVAAESVIRNAIAAANNFIFEAARARPEWSGMACVLTLAVLRDDKFTVGHVGDSRLYLFWNGVLRKLTSDHSPVGEQEDAGTLTEDEAMRHPRRNEVFRDVGSQLREASDPDFIDLKQFPFHADAALLLCSDGLSDMLTAAEITAVLDRYEGDPMQTAELLVEAANAAGGKDNITVVFVPGPEFIGQHSRALTGSRSRHTVTRMRAASTSRWQIATGALLLLVGMLLGALLWAQMGRMLPTPQVRPEPPRETHPHVPVHIAANPADARSIQQALTAAEPGDTIEIPPGQYLGPLALKSGVTLAAVRQHAATLLLDPQASGDNSAVVVARSVKDARIEGVRIANDQTHPLRSGLLVDNSSVELAYSEITGAVESAVLIQGNSSAVLRADSIHENGGAGVQLRDQSMAQVLGCSISANGKVPGALRPGIEADPRAKLQIRETTLTQNGVPEREPKSN